MIVDSLDHSGKNLLTAASSSLVIPYIPLNISTTVGGMIATPVPNPNNLLAPILLNAGSFTYFTPCCTMFIDVLIISAGNDTKLPSGDLRKPLIKSDTYA